MPSAASVQQLTVSGRETPFGVPSGYELAPWTRTGAGDPGRLAPVPAHDDLVFNQMIRRRSRQPVALPKDLRFNLPPGLVGNPDAVQQCTTVDFAATVKVTNLCPPRSVVGVATVTVYEPDLPGMSSVRFRCSTWCRRRASRRGSVSRCSGGSSVTIDTSVARAGITAWSRVCRTQPRTAGCWAARSRCGASPATLAITSPVAGNASRAATTTSTESRTPCPAEPACRRRRS